MSVLNDVYLDLDLPQAGDFEIVGFGENAVDWICSVAEYPPHDSKVRMESMVRMGGGTIATACALCARWGIRTRYVGRVGDDEAGEFSRRDLAREPMDVVMEMVPESVTHFSLIIVDRATGKRTILWEHDPKLNYDRGDIPLEKLLSAQLLLLDVNDPSASVVVSEEARNAGVLTMLDIDRVTPESGQLLSLSRIAIPSRNFVTEFAGVSDWRKAMEIVSRLCPGLLAVTLGESGAAVMWEGEIFEFASFPADVVDSTAAGDVFHGAFAFALLQGWSLEKCMRFSNTAGALACRERGARASIPNLEEVLELEKGDSL